MKLKKLLRDYHVGSLRTCQSLIESGKVRVNGKPVFNPITVIEDGDTIDFLNKSFVYHPRDFQKTEYAYRIFFKPMNVLSSWTDDYGRKTLSDFLPSDLKNLSPPLHYAGRLDYKSRGLMVFSNDGQFIQRMSHPSSGIVKTYIVTTSLPVNIQKLKDRSRGFTFENVSYSAFEFQLLDKRKFQISLHEGKKREIRMICRSFGNHVTDLLRIKIGIYTLSGLTPGKWKIINPAVCA